MIKSCCNCGNRRNCNTLDKLREMPCREYQLNKEILRNKKENKKQ